MRAVSLWPIPARNPSAETAAPAARQPSEAAAPYSSSSQSRLASPRSPNAGRRPGSWATPAASAFASLAAAAACLAASSAAATASRASAGSVSSSGARPQPPTGPRGLHALAVDEDQPFQAKEIPRGKELHGSVPAFSPSVKEQVRHHVTPEQGLKGLKLRVITRLRGETGIGRATVRLFAELGETVIVTGRRPGPLHAPVRSMNWQRSPASARWPATTLTPGRSPPSCRSCRTGSTSL